jgi:isocitrate dehydrogenase (NAD+)
MVAVHRRRSNATIVQVCDDELNGAPPHRVTLIPGDGIGPDVIDAARRALEATGVAFEWDRQEAGAELFEREGDPMPPGVIESIRERGAALKGPTSTPRGAGFRSINLALRQELDLYAGIRPCKAYPGVATARAGTDLTIVRMNHEDLYAGIEYAHSSPEAAALRDLIASTDGSRLADDVGLSIKPISISASRRVARRAFAYARASGRSTVTAVHKATVMRHTDGLFLRAVSEVAEEYADIAFDDRLVDSMAAELVAHPERCDVLVAPVLYGDVLSDIGAALVGGLGMAPGFSVGDGCAVFEAVHGSAPRHRGHDRANPSAAMLSGALLLRHLGEHAAADRLEAAIAAVIEEGRTVTYDVVRKQTAPVGTRAYADAVVERLASRP